MLQVFLKSYIIMGNTTMGNFTMVNCETKTRQWSITDKNQCCWLPGGIRMDFWLRNFFLLFSLGKLRY